MLRGLFTFLIGSIKKDNTLVIVRDFNIERVRCIVRPFKTNSPLIIYTYAELPFSTSAQSLKTIALHCGKVASQCGGIKDRQSRRRLNFKAGKCLYEPPQSKLLGLFDFVSSDHDGYK